MSSPLGKDLRSESVLKEYQKELITLIDDPTISKQDRKELMKTLNLINHRIKKLVQKFPKDFQELPERLRDASFRYQPIKKTQKSSSLKNEVVMDTEELSGGRSTRRRRAHRVTHKRKGFMKRSNK